MDDSCATRWDLFLQRLLQQNQFSIKLGLDSMNRALRLSALEHPSHRVILVAGTNGKGTCASSIASLLAAAGVRVGLYTSPHLIDLRERFRIQGELPSKARLLEIAEPIMARFAEPLSEPCLTFFELTTLMAVSLFELEQVEVGVYEVGMGGRLDATNALTPDLCVITSIGYDHQAYLGETLDAILDEKLAIRRPKTPLFISAQDHRQVDARLTLLDHVPLYVHERNFGSSRALDPESCLREGPKIATRARDRARVIEEERLANEGDLLWWYRGGERRELAVSDWGAFHTPYQRAHLSAALAASDWMLGELSGASAADGVLEQGRALIPRMRWPGRLDDRRAKEPALARHSFLLDAAHNEDGARGLFDQLSRTRRMPDAIFFSALKDKDLGAMLRELERYLAREAARGERAPLLISSPIDSPRAASRAQLEAAFLESELGSHGELQWHESSGSFISWLRSSEVPYRVLCFGSIYLLGEIFTALGVEPERLHLT